MIRLGNCENERGFFSDLGGNDAGSLTVVVGVTVEVGGALASLLVYGVVLAHAGGVLHLETGIVVLCLNLRLVDSVAHSLGNLENKIDP